MAELEQTIAELESVKQSFKSNIDSTGVSTSGVEFRAMPNLMTQLEKKLPTQTKSVTPSKSSQSVSPDTGYKLTKVEVGAVTKDIDSNIKSENIKKNVSILGVVGSFEGSGGGETSVLEEYNARIYVDNNGQNVLALDSESSAEKNYVAGQITKGEYSTLYLVNI